MGVKKSKRRRLIVMIVIIAVVAVVAVVLSRGSCTPSDSTLQSQQAPDFTLPTISGANITLSELKGTPLVLNFWATTCGHCLGELPYFEAVAQESEQEIEIIAVNVGQSASTVQSFFGDYDLTMTVALDEEAKTFSAYSLRDNPRGYIPFTVFVGKEGIVQHLQLGAFRTEADLWDTLNSVFEL